MFNDEAMKIIELHEDRISIIQQRLYRDQMDLNEAYMREWRDLNHLIKTGQWNEKATFKGNCYGLKVGDEMYVLQLDSALPFLPNNFYRSFEKTYKEFYATKLLLSLQLRDVIEQFGDGYMRRAAALFIKHYYHNVRMFDLDNKAKQVIINTLRQFLIKDDTVDYLSGFREDAVWNDLWEERGNRTMMYLCPYEKRIFMETEITSQYPRIDNMPGVIEGRIPKTMMSPCPCQEDNVPKGRKNNSCGNSQNSSKKRGRNWESMDNFM
jgi:hypothetical protein